MKKAILPLAAVLLLLAFGCSEHKVTAPGSTNQVSNETAVDVQQVVDENTDADWSQPEKSVVFQGQLDSVDTNFDVYAVAFIWGQCAKERDSVAAPTDWSGSLLTNAVGALRVRNVFRFEPGQDTVYPQPDSVSVMWSSITSRDVDGLGLMVRVKRGVTYVTAPTLKFSTAPFSIELPIDSLARYSRFFKVDDHNGIVVAARLLPRFRCPQGGIVGVWHRDSSRNAGPFEALWLRGDANVMIWPPDPRLIFAKAHGRFFMTEDGQRLFRGRYADNTGTEIGDLFGKWEYDDMTMCPMCGQGHARFRGRFTRDGQGEVGSIQGELGFGPGPTRSLMDMPLRGHWLVECRDSIPSTSEGVN